MRDIYAALYDYSDEWKTILEREWKPKCEVCGFCTEKKTCHRKPNKIDIEQLQKDGQSFRKMIDEIKKIEDFKEVTYEDYWAIVEKYIWFF